MTGKERISAIMKRKPVDRIGVYEHFWSDTQKAWSRQGFIHDTDDLADIFGFDMDSFWTFEYTAKHTMVPEIIEETEQTILTRDGNGALLRRHKLHDSTPEHVDFLVQDNSGWLEHIKPFLSPEHSRIDFEGYRRRKQASEENGRFFCWSGVNVFEQMHPVCGHEHMLAGMALDPDWVKDMFNTYSDFTIQLWEELFSAEGLPDGIWFYEDMGFKERPFMSPAMYREIILPGHKKTIQWAKQRNLPVIMHSCGFVEPLLPGMLEAGIDCLQVIEVKAGMDPVRIHRQYKDILSLMGGIDVRVLYSNDRREIDKELESKIPLLKEGYGYVLHSDHSIPESVDIDTYRYVIEKGLELGSY